MSSIPLIQGFVCLTCGRPLPDGGAHCFFCRKSGSSKLFIRSAGLYKAGLKACILKFKFNNALSLKRPFGRLLYEAISWYPELSKAEMLVPIPLHWRRRLARGYNQAELLAQELSRCTGLPLQTCVLARSRATQPQYGLTRAHRLMNVSEAFCVRNPAPIFRKTILLIDDVCTTGATFRECTKALRRAGAKEVLALSLARQC